MQKTYPTRFEESDILKEVLDDSLSHSTSYFFEQDVSSANAKFSPKIILEHLDRKGLNVVPLIMQYLGSLEKKQIPTAFVSLFLQLLTFDAMEELRSQVKSKYSFDLYTRSDFIMHTWVVLETQNAARRAMRPILSEPNECVCDESNSIRRIRSVG